MPRLDPIEETRPSRGTPRGQEYFPAERDDLESYQPKRFNSRHRAVCILLAQGFANNEIAEITGYSESRVSTIKNDPRATAVIREAEKEFMNSLGDVASKIEALAHEAVDVAAQVMRDAKDESVALRSAFGLLDRGGYGKVQKNINMNADLSGEAMRALLREEKEAEAQDDAIDVSYSIEESA